jgi:hypothetical protein
MSYVIHLWEHEAPRSMVQALQLHEQLLVSSAPAPVSRFSDLLARLVKRFPAEVGGQDADVATWVEPAPPRVDVDGVVLSLALYGEGPVLLLSALIDEADALGLTVLDEQGGCVYLPGRQQLDMDGVSARPAARAPTKIDAERLTVGIVRARIKALLQAPLQRHGFVMGKGGDTWSEFQRQTPAGLQVIKIYRAMEVWQHLFYCSLTPALPPTVAVAVAPAKDIRLFVPSGAPLQAFPRYDYSDSFDCFVACSIEELDLLLSAFLASIETLCLPVFDACLTALDVLNFDAGATLDGAHMNDSAVLLALNHLTAHEDMALLLDRQGLKTSYDRGRKRILNEVAARLAALHHTPPDL